MLARAGCGGRAFSASRPRAQGQRPWHRLFRTREIAAMWGMLAIIVILSGAKNLFWAKLQMFRCAQHDGCSGSSQRSERQTKCSQTSVSSAYRFFVALLLRMTKREELRSARRVGTKLFIVRKLRSRLECTAGGNALGKEESLSIGWQRSESRISRFSRASRSPAARRLAKLAPLASARDIMAAWRTRTFIKNGLGCGSRNSSDH